MANTVYRQKTILEGLSEIAKEGFISLRGTGREYKIEPKPKLQPCARRGEVIEEKFTNVFMVWGRDRPGSCESGYGGRGPETHNSSFRIIVGAMGAKAKSVDPTTGVPIETHPNTGQDAATLYMSQKTDIDDDWMLAGKPSAITRSAVGIKADGVRIVARESLRLYSGASDCNSQGGPVIAKAHGVELISNNDASDLQPLVKGDNLVKALKRIVHHVSKLNGIVDSMVHIQVLMNTQIASHSHLIAPLGGILVAAPSPELFAGISVGNADMVLRSEDGLLNHKINLATFELNYLTATGSGWICSMSNKTT